MGLGIQRLRARVLRRYVNKVSLVGKRFVRYKRERCVRFKVILFYADNKSKHHNGRC